MNQVTLIVLVVEADETRDARPAWLERIVRAFSLKSVPNSKYASALELTHPGFVRR